MVFACEFEKHMFLPKKDWMVNTRKDLFLGLACGNQPEQLEISHNHLPSGK